MEPILQTHGLTKRYKTSLAVDGVDLSVRRGERVALLGPNGAGKTTTLFMILGVVTPDSGWVEVAGERLPEGRSRAMQQVGFSAGYMPLAERLRVGEFLTLYGRLYGIPHPEPRIRESLEAFGATGLLQAMSTDLSSGQRTLMGIVKATLHRPPLLILDEPTASLDPEIALQVRTGLRRICDEEGTALLVTSHNMVEVERLCERVVFLSGGRVVADDTPANVAARFGRMDLEQVFLHLAGQGDGQTTTSQQTDHTA